MRSFYYTWTHQPADDVFTVVGAEHDEFVLADGRRVYDFLSTSFQSSFGHSHPAIRAAIHSQLDSMPIASPRSTFELKQRVSARLCDLLGLAGGKIFYTVSGAEAVENALKMARQVTGRTVIAARQRSYHGASLGALSVTGDWRNATHFTLDDQTVRIPEPADDPDLHSTAQLVDDRCAAVILETITGANGVVIPDGGWLSKLAEHCRQQGVLLILDEVLCGFARTGPPFAMHHYGVKPDLVCMAKGFTGGYIPFGAVWTGPRIVQYYDQEKMSCGLTNFAHPLGLAAASAVLDLLGDDTFLQQKATLESEFCRAIEQIGARSAVRDVRCRGLLAAIQLADRPAPSWQTMFDAGLHAFSREDTVIVAPPFVSTCERLDQAFAKLAALLPD